MLQKLTSYQNIAFAGACLIVIGLIFSRFLQSAGVAIVFLSPLISGQFREYTRQNKYSILLILFFLITFFSILYTDNSTEFWKDITRKLPFLLLPIALAALQFTSKQKWTLVAILYAGCFIAGTQAFINYLLNFEEYNKLITQSKPIPILGGDKYLDHIYFSILLAFSCIAGWVYLLVEEVPKRFRMVLVILNLILIFYLHSISARTGLLSFYVAVMTGAIWYAFSKRKYLTGILLPASLLLFLILAVLFIPSLNLRYQNTLTDIDRYSTGQNINYYSISQRIEALDVSWHLFKKNPVTGVSPADFNAELQEEYTRQKTSLLPENRIKPHNQFVETAVSLGIIGFVSLLLIFLIPAFSGSTYSRPLFLLFLVIIFVAMQVESIFERQIGITFFSLFYTILSKPKIPTHEA